jgi:hypothetical protein
MADKNVIIWRHWYNSEVLERFTPAEYEFHQVIEFYEIGEDIAHDIADYETRYGSELFREDTEIVIISPEKFAGTYKIYVTYEPQFFVEKEEN